MAEQLFLFLERLWCENTYKYVLEVTSLLRTHSSTSPVLCSVFKCVNIFSVCGPPSATGQGLLLWIEHCFQIIQIAPLETFNMNKTQITPRYINSKIQRTAAH